MKIYAAESLFLVEHIRAVLQREGIETSVSNQYLSGGVGDIPAFECWPELWLKDVTQERRALEIIKQALAHDSDAVSWQCPQCQESIEGQFGQCWNCGAAYPQ